MDSCCLPICSNDDLLEEEPQAKAVAAAKSKAVAAATAAAEAALRPRLEPSAGSAAVADGGVLALHCHLQHVKTHQQRQVGSSFRTRRLPTPVSFNSAPAALAPAFISENYLADLSAGAASGFALKSCHDQVCEQLVACYRAAARAAKPLARQLGCRCSLMVCPSRWCLGGRVQVVAPCPLGILCRYASCCFHCPERPSLVSPLHCAFGSEFACALDSGEVCHSCSAYTPYLVDFWVLQASCRAQCHRVALLNTVLGLERGGGSSTG